MNKKFYFGTVIIMIAVQLNLSCKKETSCEGCGTNNQPPVAIAGPDQVIMLPTDSVSLAGYASSDPDGTIREWLWKKISGPASFNIITPGAGGTKVKNLVAGVYQFELMVTDDRGRSAKDTVGVMVNDPNMANRPPVARAGIDQTVMLPTSSVLLDGSSSSDPDNNIISYLWTKISGPTPVGIIYPTAVQTQANNLSLGTYQFELKVTDATGLFALDTTEVSVIDAAPPCADCRIVFVSSRDGNPEIYSTKTDGSVIQRLTYSSAADYQPAWSPDGSYIAFISDRSGHPELYIMDANGSNVVRKTFSVGGAQTPCWSPDGSKIAYESLSNGSSNIWVLDVMSEATSLLFAAPGWDAHPGWSPDGMKMVLVSDWAAYDFVYDIYTINSDGTGFTALTGNIFDQINYVYPSWSPNGLKIAFATIDGTGTSQTDAKIGVMNADGSGLAQLILNAAAWTRTSWSDDGTKILYTSLSPSGRDVSWVSVDGSLSGTIVTNGWDADWRH